MIKALILTFTILTQTPAYADSICENYFLINHNRKNLRTFQKLNNERIRYYNDNIENSSDLNLQMKLINEQYQYESSLVYSSIQQIKTSKKAIRLKSASPDEYHRYINLKEDKLMRRHVDQIETLTKTLSSVLKQYDIPHKLLKAEITSFKIPYHYISIDMTSNTSYKSIKALQKFKDLFDVSSFTVDLMLNIKFGSSGFRTLTQIDIGVDGIFNILNDDLLLLITKHESKHASFEKQRKLLMPSPFHTTFRATGIEPLSTIEHVRYTTFMGAEELYNYANNSFWASSRLLKRDKFTYNEKLGDFLTMREEVVSASGIAKQTKVLTQNFSKLFKDIKEIQIPKNQFNMTFMDGNGQPTNSIDEVVSFAILNSESHHYTKLFIEKELRQVTEEYMQINQKVMKELNDEVQRKGAPKSQEEADEFFREFAQKESIATKHLQAIFIENALRQMKELELMADKVIKAAPKLVEKQNIFLELLESSIKNDPNYLKSEAWRDQFQKQAQLARTFGNLVK
jgi:hypothetical protein